MKSTQKKYDSSLRSKGTLKVERCKRAASRSETYSFGNKYDDVALSYELKGNLAFKQDFYSRSDYGGSIWSDRTSDIGAPFGAELFLQNERAMPETMFGGPRFYFHELRDEREEVPDARSKFPYDRVAHKAAKMITRMFRRNLGRKNKAATIIQKSVKKYTERVSAKVETQYWNDCVSMIQKLYLRKKTTLRRNSVRRKAEVSSASFEIKLRAQVIAQRRIDEQEERRNAFMFVMVTRLARNFIHRRRKARAAARRELIYARRLQANFRGRKQRKEMKRLKDARIFVIYWWRKHWRRKYRNPATKIQRCYRKRVLRKAVIKIQQLARMKIGHRDTTRKRLEIVATERARNNREFIVVERNMKEISEDVNWMSDDEQVPPITMSDHMRRLDLYCLAVLTASPLQLSEEEFQTIHPAEFGEDDYAEETVRLHSIASDSFEKRIVIAVLNLFANRPGGCLDRAAMLVCREFLRPSSSGGLSLEAWNNMANYPMTNVNNLALVLEPSTSLKMRVRINGRGRYMPPLVLAKAVLVNRWTMHYEWITRQQIVKFRKFFPPRRVCKFCMEPLMFDGDVHDQRNCCRNGYFSWIQKALESIVKALVKECNRIVVPYMKRPWMQDNKKLAIAAGGLSTKPEAAVKPGVDACDPVVAENPKT